VLRILLTRRWVILSLVFFLLIPVMYWLGTWQFHRYQQTNHSNAQMSANLHAAPTPMVQLSRPGGTVPASETYRKVSAVGRYDGAHSFVVRHRTDASGDTIGFYLVTPLVSADGQVVLVNRGWVTPGNTTGNQYPAVPGTPTGTVTVTGLLRPDETTANSGIRDIKGLPDRQYMLINSAEQSRRLGEPVVGGYLELNTTTPGQSAADSAQTVPWPTQDSGSQAVVGKGVHLPYAIQWWLFALMIPAGWWALLRREVRDTRRKEELAAKKAAFLAGLDGTAAGAPADAAADTASSAGEGTAAEDTPDGSVAAATGVGG
jgi:cytochrome oxidase assembly protein ShyY1